MLLILGGTTEGRMAAKVADEAGKPFYYSTYGMEQKLQMRNGIRISGGFDAEGMQQFCTDNNVKLIIDAAHPFATMLHQNAGDTAKELRIPIIRYERIYPEPCTDFVWCEDYADACEKMQALGVKKLLALTGVKTIGKLNSYWKHNECIFRVLNREESVDMALKQGFPAENLIFYTGENNTEQLIRLHRADAIITKESGQSGGFTEKTEAARNAGARIFVVRRPSLPYLTNNGDNNTLHAIVNGPHGLRRCIEKTRPEFFQLRTGFTTGSCATAASKAALTALLQQTDVREVEFTLPNGETMSMPIEKCEWHSNYAKASVIKDAGDDPDITNGITIESTIRLSDSPGVHFLQGEGVGKVTLPGLGLNVGEPAINPVPRTMITNELCKLHKGGLDVIISVPNGKDIAKRTFNPKVGVIGGISILGTSGIVRPLSSDAYVESMSREIDVCKAVGSDTLILNSGAKSEQAVKNVCQDVESPQAFVHYGNFIGEALRLAHEKGIGEVRLGVMIGKAVKLAEGHLDTHSHKVVMNKEFLISLAEESGCNSTDIIDGIRRMTLARELYGLLTEYDSDKYFTTLLHHCMKHCRKVYPDGKLTIMLVGEDGNIINSLSIRA